jgi:hypothetical protein
MNNLFGSCTQGVAPMSLHPGLHICRHLRGYGWYEVVPKAGKWYANRCFWSMQAAIDAQHWLGWSGAAGMAGATLIGAVALHFSKKRQRELRNERPPQTELLLRSPGLFAMERLEELRDQMEMHLLVAISAAAVCGLLVAGFASVLLEMSRQGFTWGAVLGAKGGWEVIALIPFAIAALAAAIFLFRKLPSLMDETRSLRLGMRGEQAVAEKLADRELAAAGYVAFHDLQCERGENKWNVDHVVVGPGGVFVLETKACSRRNAKWKQEEHEVIYDGKELTFPWRYDRDAVPQARRNADWVREYLGVYAPKGVHIQAVVVVPGWFVRDVNGSSDVKVMNARYLVPYLRNAQRRYESEQLKIVVAKLEEKCRVVEF